MRYNLQDESQELAFYDVGYSDDVCNLACLIPVNPARRQIGFTKKEQYSCSVCRSLSIPAVLICAFVCNKHPNLVGSGGDDAICPHTPLQAPMLASF